MTNVYKERLMMIITLNELRELEASTKRQRMIDAIYFVLRQILEFDAEIRTNECENLFSFEIVDSFLKKKLFVFFRERSNGFHL